LPISAIATRREGGINWVNKKKLKGLLYDTTKQEKPLGIKAKEM